MPPTNRHTDFADALHLPVISAVWLRRRPGAVCQQLCPVFPVDLGVAFESGAN
jgi:hypothetical protein